MRRRRTPGPRAHAHPADRTRSHRPARVALGLVPALATLLLALPGCSPGEASMEGGGSGSAESTGSPGSPGSAGSPGSPGSAVAEGAAETGSPGSAAPEFRADSAFALIERQVAFGPRVPGTEGHAAQLAWMTSYLEARADTLWRQEFRHTLPDGTVLELTNLFAQFQPTTRDRILLVAHWDTRPTADMELDTALQSLPIPGANDGASGTAVLLELADVLSRHSPPIGVDLLLVDGEDYARDHMYLGAEHFAAAMPPGYAPLYGVVVDMVADRDPRFPQEGYSRQYAPEVVERVWTLAEELGYGDYFPRVHGMAVTDDHVPLNRAGIRSIDIIDFDYGPGNAYWHTLRDDLEHVSPEGPGVVGEVLVELVWRGG